MLRGELLKKDCKVDERGKQQSNEPMPALAAAIRVGCPRSSSCVRDAGVDKKTEEEKRAT